MTETPGLGAFVDPKLNDVVKRWPAKDRVSADELALLFAMLRPNDLIWNYGVNNYLMGSSRRHSTSYTGMRTALA